MRLCFFFILFHTDAWRQVCDNNIDNIDYNGSLNVSTTTATLSLYYEPRNKLGFWNVDNNADNNERRQHVYHETKSHRCIHLNHIHSTSFHAHIG